MARRIRRASDGQQLRADILDELRETQGWLAEVLPCVNAELAALEGGGEVELTRWDLPEWCPQRHIGGLHDRVVLRADNTITAAPSP